VLAYTNTFDHLNVVQACAPRGIHIMVEKPLAVNFRHAIIMDSLVRKHSVWLLTNYETTWYETHHQLYQQAVEGEILGPIRKMVFHHGHQGPIEIGCGPAFTNWLCDPRLNGAGALMDFGCYGVNLSTWFTKGEPPRAVLAVTQQIKPDMYTAVDDEATIIIIWPDKQAIIQASWNWPYGRKDMALYGKEGSATADRRDLKDSSGSRNATLTPKRYLSDPYSYLFSVIRGEHVPAPYEPSSLENNLLTMKILSAALLSARQGQRISLTNND
jgi:predicted dehydrogenase